MPLALTWIKKIDAIQRRFLRVLDVSEEHALMDFNLAPLCIRRRRAMLGAVYRCVHHLAHEDLCSLFTRSQVEPLHRTRSVSIAHNYQLEDPCADGSTSDVLARSIFGLVRVWNRLPSDVVNMPTVAEFQGALQKMVKQACCNNSENWQNMFLR